MIKQADLPWIFVTTLLDSHIMNGCKHLLLSFTDDDGMEMMAKGKTMELEGYVDRDGKGCGK